MSQKLPRLTGNELGRILKRAGWDLDRVAGNHFIYVKPGTPETLSVPNHKREMSIGTLRRLLRDASIDRRELERLWRKKR